MLIWLRSNLPGSLSFVFRVMWTAKDNISSLGFNAVVLDSSVVADKVDTFVTVKPFDPLMPINGPKPMDPVDIPIDMGPSNPIAIDPSVPLGDSPSSSSDNSNDTIPEGVFLDSSSPDDSSLNSFSDSSSNPLEDSADFPDSPLVTTIVTVVDADQTPEATSIDTPVAIPSEVSGELADPVAPVPVGGASLNSFFLQFSRSSFCNYSSLHLNIN